MVRFWVLVALSVAALLVGTGCKKKPKPGDGWESNHGVTTTPAPPPAPLPLEPPVELSRVPNSGLPCAIDDLLASKCRRCHTKPTRHTAPFALLTWDDTQELLRDRKRYLVMESAVRSGYMPYNIAANPPVERLTDAEKQIIIDWVEAGAPRGTCGSSGPGASASARPAFSGVRPHPRPKPSL